MELIFQLLRHSTQTTFATANGNIPNDPNSTSIVIGAGLTASPLNLTLGESLTLTWFEYGDQAEIIANHTLATKVAAVLPKIGGFTLSGPSDDEFYLQINTAEQFFNTTEASAIMVSLTTTDKAVITNVTQTIQTHYNNQVTALSATDSLSTIQSVFTTVEAFIGAIAAIALIVAGIGIMNVQITSVLKRTREIGILKAIGAKDRTVLSIFLFETLLIGLIGAVIGHCFGI